MPLFDISFTLTDIQHGRALVEAETLEDAIARVEGTSDGPWDIGLLELQDAAGDGEMSVEARASPEDGTQASELPILQSYGENGHMTDELQGIVRRIVQGCVQFGDFTLASGKKSSYYIDLRRVTMSPMVFILAEAIGWKLGTMRADSNRDFDGVAGPAVGAVPLVTAVQIWHGTQGGQLQSREIGCTLSGGYVKAEAKAHGTGGQLFGCLRPGDRVVVLEDVTTTGESLWNTCRVLQEHGMQVVAAVTVLDRLDGAAAMMLEKGIAFGSLLTIQDLTLTTGGGLP